MAVVIVFAVLFFLVGMVFIFSFVFAVFATMKRNRNNVQFNTNSGNYWDESGGSTYVTLPTGERRLN